VLGFILSDRLPDFSAPQVRLTAVELILVSPKSGSWEVFFYRLLERILKNRLNLLEDEKQKSKIRLLRLKSVLTKYPGLWECI